MSFGSIFTAVIEWVWFWFWFLKLIFVLEHPTSDSVVNLSANESLEALITAKREYRLILQRSLRILKNLIHYTNRL